MSVRPSMRLSRRSMKASPEHVQKLPKLMAINSLSYTEQAIAFLNAFWTFGKLNIRLNICSEFTNQYLIRSNF